MPNTTLKSFVGISLLLIPFLCGCGRPHNGSGGGAQDSSSGPTTAQQQIAFQYPQFANVISMHILADDYLSTRKLLSASGTVDWDTYIRSNIGCVQQGYATNQGQFSVPSVDGYNISNGSLEAGLEKGGLRTYQSFNLTLNPTPWGSITRSFQCLVNTDKMQALAAGQDIHGNLNIPVGQRICARWTFANSYQTATPGQGNVQVFSGTFAYTIKPLIQGVQFLGAGTATVKMYLSPDNGQWVMLSFTQHDPSVSFGALTSAVRPDPTPSACPGP